MVPRTEGPARGTLAIGIFPALPQPLLKPPMAPGTNCKVSISHCYPPASSALSCSPDRPLSAPQSTDPSNPFFSSGSGELRPPCSGHTTLNQSGLVDSSRRHGINEPVSQWDFSSSSMNTDTSDLHICIKTKANPNKTTTKIKNKQKQKQTNNKTPDSGIWCWATLRES